MAGNKTVSMSFRVSPEFKRQLEIAAAREGRNLTNTLEYLLLSYCRQHALTTSEREVEQDASWGPA